MRVSLREYGRCKNCAGVIRLNACRCYPYLNQLGFNKYWMLNQCHMPKRCHTKPSGFYKLSNCRWLHQNSISKLVERILLFAMTNLLHRIHGHSNHGGCQSIIAAVNNATIITHDSSCYMFCQLLSLRQLNQMFTALITTVHLPGGEVIRTCTPCQTSYHKLLGGYETSHVQDNFSPNFV